MARKLYRVERGNWIGEFPPAGGFRSGQRGIRRKLCSVDAVSHLSDAALHQKLQRLYEKVQADLSRSEEEKQALRKKQRADKKRSSVTVALQQWVDELSVTNDDETVGMYKKSVALYLKSCGDHEVRDFDRTQNITFLKFLKKQPGKAAGSTMAASTQNKHIRHFGIFLKWCFDHDIIDRRHSLKIPSVPKKDMETYEVADLTRAKLLIENKVKEYSRPQDRRAIVNMYRAFMLASNTILRLGAIWSLPLSAIDMKRRVIRIKEVPELGWKPKRMKFPIKPINDALYDFLKEDLKGRAPGEKWYLDKGNGCQWHKDRSNISSYAAEIFHELGLPRIKPFHYGFRATMITHLLHSGVKPQTVQQLADHSSLKTTMFYFNTRTVDQREATNAIPTI